MEQGNFSIDPRELQKNWEAAEVMSKESSRRKPRQSWMFPIFLIVTGVISIICLLMTYL